MCKALRGEDIFENYLLIRGKQTGEYHLKDGTKIRHKDANWFKLT
jgi:hypothetical protein